ncbi:MAG: phosphonoacetaldehyde reductase [Ruminococcus flavefaciens]|nr:phosphonoacetaldehyde reductase [Ruminococcus flavefaciens]
MGQRYLEGNNYKEELHKLFVTEKYRAIFLVCGNSAEKLDIFQWLHTEVRKLGRRMIVFQKFEPNPKYSSVELAINQFISNECDIIIAVGGGSAIDVAKCVKLGWEMKREGGRLIQSAHVRNVPMIAVPTTAGTGSEATQFAVIYYEGEKQSVSHPAGLPEYVVLDENNLRTLPICQRKATVLDALSHAIESMWSVNSNDESCEYAEHAIRRIICSMNRYIREAGAEKELLIAANEAGKAINFTKTTAAHAMCYKLTSLYGIPHGCAVMLCLPELWEFMCAHTDKCADGRGKEFLEGQFQRIAACLGHLSAKDAIEYLKQLRKDWEVDFAYEIKDDEMDLLVSAVNVERLKGNPVELTKKDLKELYRKILKANGSAIDGCSSTGR